MKQVSDAVWHLVIRSPSVKKVCIERARAALYHGTTPVTIDKRGYELKYRSVSSALHEAMSSSTSKGMSEILTNHQFLYPFYMTAFAHER